MYVVIVQLSGVNMRSLLLVVFVSLILLSTAVAQSTSGSITGSVVDAQGAAMAGVTITATNVETNVSYTAKTEPSGDFVMPNLPPAKYSATIEMAGFKKY